MKIPWIPVLSVCLALAQTAARGGTVFNDTFESPGATRQDDANDAADVQWRPRIGSQAGAYSITNDPLRNAGIAHPCVAALTTDEIGYIPTKEEYQKSGYEVTASFYGESVGQLMLDHARTLGLAVAKK